MKRNLLLLLVAVGLDAQAQVTDTSTVFVERPIAEVLKMAEQQQKLVFVDCYTSWCGPCKVMARDVFPRKVVGEYFNAHFVSTQIDMEKGEGPSLAEKWDVSAYPTLLVLDTKGNIQFRLVGSNSPEAFVDSVKYMMEHHVTPEFVVRYQEGDRSVETMKAYIAYLEKARERRTLSHICEEFLTLQKANIINDDDLWRLYSQYTIDPKSEPFLYVAALREEAVRKRGEKAGMTIDDKWRMHVKSFYITSKDPNGLGFDNERAMAYETYMKEHGVDKAHDYIMAYKLPYAMIHKNLEELLAALDDTATMPSISESQFNFGCKTARQLIGTDKKQLKRLEKIEKKREKTVKK